MSPARQAKTWDCPAASVPLVAGAIHVWRIGLDDVHSDTGLLNPLERDRAVRMLNPSRRRYFEAGRIALRRILAWHTGLDAASVDITQTAHGKPVTEGLSFNLSHSGPLALCAVTAAWPVGVDIEAHQEGRDLEGVAQRFFAPEEEAVLEGLGETRFAEAFYRCWTAKEAVLKARGEGLRYPLSEIVIAADPATPLALLRMGDDDNAAKRWHLATVDAGPGYTAAIAVEGQPETWCYWDASTLA